MTKPAATPRIRADLLSVTVRFRVTPDDKRIIAEAARQEGQRPTTFIRDSIIDKAVWSLGCNSYPDALRKVQK